MVRNRSIQWSILTEQEKLSMVGCWPIQQGVRVAQEKQSMKERGWWHVMPHQRPRVMPCQDPRVVPRQQLPDHPRSGQWPMVGPTELEKCFVSPRGWPTVRLDQIDEEFIHQWKSSTVDCRVGRFSVELWIGCQGIGTMTDDQVDRLGKVLCALKGERQLSIVDRVKSTAHISCNLRSTTRI